MKNRKLKIGIAGMRRGMGFGRLFASRKDCEVTAVCDLNQERAHEAAAALGCEAMTDYDELCNQELDAIVIVTPVPTHLDCTVKALDAGKHVLCEIPAVSTLSEAKMLLAKVRDTGLKYMAAENVNYFPCIQQMHQMVKEGKIGDIAYAEGEYVHGLPLLCFNRDDGLGGGTSDKPSWRASMDPIRYCTHETGPLLMILEDRVVSAVGMEGAVEVKTSRITPTQFPTKVQTALFKTERGRVIREVVAFFISREPAHHFYALYGTKGSIETDRYRWMDNLKVYLKDDPDHKEMFDMPTSVIHAGLPPEAVAGGHGTSEYLMIDDFVRAILEDRTPPLDVYKALEMTLPGICAAESIKRGGEPIPVPNYRVTHPR
ncbi:MAG TPA: Gfo/Idh/MocA family oxidoreductase [bacterium]|nr:Gfo/Idh/MocA family oxidoreductase [bacterium]HPP30390.1 Gfo/Idh/MocA family oxidoreductase [bacterium]